MHESFNNFMFAKFYLISEHLFQFSKFSHSDRYEQHFYIATYFLYFTLFFKCIRKVNIKRIYYILYPTTAINKLNVSTNTGLSEDKMHEIA